MEAALAVMMAGVRRLWVQRVGPAAISAPCFHQAGQGANGLDDLFNRARGW